MVVTGVLTLGGGIAAVNRLVLRSLLEDNCIVEVFSLAEDEEPTLSYPEYHPQLKYKVFKKNKFAFSIAVWGAWIKNNYDLIFSDQINLSLILAPLRLIFGEEYVVWVHGLECLPPYPNWEGAIGARFASKCLASSNFTKKNLLERFPKLSVATCEPSLDPESHTLDLPETVESLDVPEILLVNVEGRKKKLNKKVILHVGRMDPEQRYKGQDVLIYALPTIQENAPGAQLVLVGGGDDLERIRGIAKSQPQSVRENIFITGYVDDERLTDLYKACYLFAMPSRAEGFGIVYIEAMRWQKPCIGGKIDAASCVIQDGVTGVLVDSPSSATQVAEAINYLVSESETAHRMGVAGYNLVRERFLYPSFKRRFLAQIKRFEY